LCVCRREVAVVGRVCSGAEEADSYGMSDNSIYLVDSVNMLDKHAGLAEPQP
jgi:hypothetical protein